MSHDVVNDFLQAETLPAPRGVEAGQRPDCRIAKNAFLIVDDSVQDKRYSRFIELVRAQYSGNEHGVVQRDWGGEFGA